MSQLFRNLTESEELEFRRWARDNYVPHSDIQGDWHPVIQIECALINAGFPPTPEAGQFEHIGRSNYGNS